MLGKEALSPLSNEYKDHSTHMIDFLLLGLCEYCIVEFSSNACEIKVVACDLVWVWRACNFSCGIYFVFDLGFGFSISMIEDSRISTHGHH